MGVTDEPCIPWTCEGPAGPLASQLEAPLLGVHLLSLGQGHLVAL